MNASFRIPYDGLSTTYGGLGFGTENLNKAALYFVQDNNWNRGSLQFAVNTAGDNTAVSTSDTRMTIKSNGNIGVGTTSPDSLFEVQSTTSEKLRLTYTDNSVYSNFSVGSDGVLNIGSTGNQIIMNGTQNQLSMIAASPYDAGAGGWGGIGIGTNSPKTALIFEQTANWSRGKLHVAVDGAADSGSAQLSDAVATFDIGGNVGIGQTSPGAKLDVNGNIRLGATGANNLLNTSAAGGAPSGNLYWGNRTLCDSTGNCGGSGVTGSGSANQVAFWDAAGTALTYKSNLTWDNTNSRLGIGSGSTVAPLQVNGNEAYVYNPANGQAAYRLYNNGSVAEWSLRQPASATTSNFNISKLVSGTYTDFLTLTTSSRVGILNNNPQNVLDIGVAGTGSTADGMQLNTDSSNVGPRFLRFSRSASTRFDFGYDGIQDNFFVSNGSTIELAGNRTGNFQIKANPQSAASPDASSVLSLIDDAAAVTTSQYGLNVQNLTTNTTTNAINKYGLYATSTGSFTGSTGAATNNYGLYLDTVSGADNNYGLYVNTTAQNYMAGALSVGTNGTNPGMLEVRSGGTATGSIFSTYSGGQFTAINSGNSFSQIAFRSGDPLLFGVWDSTAGANWSEKMRLDNTGLGIGTTASNKLSVNGTIDASKLALGATSLPGSTKLFVSDGGSVYGADSTTRLFVDQAGSGVVAQFNGASAADEETLLGFSYRNAAGTAPVSIGYHVDTNGWSNFTQGSLVFKTRNTTNATAPTERMRIGSDGNVGIGTVPFARISIAGTSTGNSGTGTITCSGFTCTGSGTSFTTQLKVGDRINTSGGNATVYSIASNTSLTMVGDDISGSGLSFTYDRPYEKVDTSGGTTLEALDAAGTRTIFQQSDLSALTLLAPNINNSTAFIVDHLPNASAKAFSYRITGESYSRGVFYADGSMGWGPGSSTRDTYLSRSAANTLRIDNDKAGGAANLIVAGNYNVNGNTTIGDASTDTITLNAKNISFPNSLDFDTTNHTLYLDNTNHRVGIGLNNPSTALSVNGTGKFTQLQTGSSGNATSTEFNDFNNIFTSNTGSYVNLYVTSQYEPTASDSGILY